MARVYSIIVLGSMVLYSVSAFLAPVTELSRLGGRSAVLQCASCVALRRAGCLEKRATRVGSLSMAAGPAPPESKALSHPLASLLAECKDFGLVRFISVNPTGSVLETAARMDLGMKGFTVPGKGEYITIASEDKLFECHLNLNLVRSATLSQEPAKIGGHTLHVLRLKDAKGAIMLSCMLQYDPSKGAGNYFPGAVDAFEAVLRKHGPEVQFPAPPA